MAVSIGNSWDEILKDQWSQKYYLSLRNKLIHEYQNFTIYPPANDIFNALRSVDYNDVKVVIIGQDPYHGPGQAHGYSFSVQKGVRIPPSLRNIFKEMHDDIGTEMPKHGNLEKWAKQGVLLLNSTLTVRRSMPNSHKALGWDILTDHIIELLGNKQKPTIFILWGNDARSKKKLIHNPNHLILESVHPSPLSASRGFFGSKPFSKTNDFLKKNCMEPINWQI